MTSFEELHRQTTTLLEKLAANFTLNTCSKSSIDYDKTEKKESGTIQEAYSKVVLNSAQNHVQFLDDYISKETNAESFDRSEHRQVFELRNCGAEVNSALTRLDVCRQALETLKQRHESVAFSTSSLHDACDQLMADQTRLAAVAEDVRTRLYYFDQVDQLVQKLNSPHLPVGGQAFTHALATIDECLVFLRQQRDYKESNLYISKYEQCLSRGLTSVKTFVQQTLMAGTTLALNERGQDRDDYLFAALYGVFATHAHSIRAVIEMVGTKFDRAPEYQSVLTDCHTMYFSQRDQLLRPSILATVRQLTSKFEFSICALTRTGCDFLLRLCQDESRLFYQFFTQPSYLLHDFNEQMCRSFYDILRPLIIHNPHLETLTEVCTILRGEVLEKRCSLNGDTYEGLARIIRELAGDVGERLVYRAYMYTKTDIERYIPAEGDLAYPEKLQLMASILSAGISEKTGDKSENTGDSAQENAGIDIMKDGDTVQTEIMEKQEDAKVQITSTRVKDRKTPLFDIQTIESSPSPTSKVQISIKTTKKSDPLSAVDLHGLWYPTVRRTVLTLSKLFKCLDVGHYERSAVFQGVSQEILTQCVQSLLSASKKIQTTRVLLEKPLDGQLFLVKHLLILREQTSPYRALSTASMKDTSVDFSKVKDSAVQLLNTKSRWFSLNTNNAVLEFLLQVPVHVLDTTTDGRRNLDIQLKRACQKLIAMMSDSVVLELVDFLNKAETMLNSEGRMSLNSHSFSTANSVQNLCSQAYRKLKDQLPVMKTSFTLYIANSDTEKILMTPIKKNIADAFVRATKFVTANYDEEEQLIIACPNEQQLSLLLNQS